MGLFLSFFFILKMTDELEKRIDELLNSDSEGEDQEEEDKKRARTGSDALLRARKMVTSKAATSAIGKKIINHVLDEETKALVDAAKDCLMEVHSLKEANRIENIIIKILLKAHIQMDKGNVKATQLDQIKPVLRSFIKTIVKIYKHPRREPFTEEERLEKFDKLKQRLMTIYNIVINAMGEHLSQKNADKFLNAMNALSDKDGWLIKCFGVDQQQNKNAEKLVDVAQFYVFRL